MTNLLYIFSLLGVHACICVCESVHTHACIWVGGCYSGHEGSEDILQDTVLPLCGFWGSDFTANAFTHRAISQANFRVVLMKPLLVLHIPTLSMEGNALIEHRWSKGGGDLILPEGK